ncbi:MAG: lipid-A-disaccharide synthase [Candidatus Aceula meridiana]|nr:lipid-A-disaccharide synthase [Candidatus Aceula meridiana]
MGQNNHLIIVAGEASGDTHAAHLVEAIKTINPKITFSGLGGPKMHDAGVELYEDLTKFAVVGFIEVLRHLGTFRKNFSLILKKVKETNAEAVILVDYPGFNLRLAKELKKLNVKVIYYISPQVWAWKESRVKLIREVVDKMIVLFPFEKDFYHKHGLEVSYVGHPLVNAVYAKTPKENILEKLRLSAVKTTVGLLPGSRIKEIKSLLPVMIKSAELLYQENPKLQFIVVRAPGINLSIFEKYLPEKLPIKIFDENFYDGINATDVCMVASGTATLETALLEKPMVVIYKTSLITWAMAKLLIKIPYIGLVNVVAGEEIVPECIQFDASPKKISKTLKEILPPSSRHAAIAQALAQVKHSLGDPGANTRAAQEIIKFLK